MRKFHFEMYKTAEFHSNLLVSWELVTESYQERPMILQVNCNSPEMCASQEFYLKLIERPVTSYGNSLLPVWAAPGDRV